jgi:uncharacterized YigZ family protein
MDRPAESISILTVDADSSSTIHEIKIKGSQFISQVYHIESVAEFEKFYQQSKKRFVKAAHYCYAYRISAELYHYYDDGEPSGTAGKPIYHVLSEKKLYQVLLIVVRYFGGIKLGRSGLVRAYSQSAAGTLQEAKVVTKVASTDISILLPYLLVQDIQYLVKKYEGIINKTDYLEQVKIFAQIPTTRYSDFKEELSLLNKKGHLILELVPNAAH